MFSPFSQKLKVKNIFSLTLLSVVASLVGCDLNNDSIAQAQQGKPKVLATHNIICDLIDTIAEDTINLTCLIDGDQDPHTFRPTAPQRQAIEEAQIIFYGGYQLEPQIINLLEATANSGSEDDPEASAKPQIALYEQAVEKPMLMAHEHKHEHEHEHDSASTDSTPDPHVWHNVENTVAVVDQLQSLFLQLNPPEAEKYLSNSVALKEQLWQLDAWIKDQIFTIPQGQRTLVTTHNSLNYYVEAYYLEDYQTLQGLSAAGSPTASQVKELVQKIKKAKVSTIFVESTKSDRVIKNVARAANTQVSEEPLFVDGLGEAENYVEMMSHNTCAIAIGLGGECSPFEEVRE